jgi:hypothetical protein
MMRFIYLACLIVSFAGMVVLDKKYCLAYFLDRRRTVLTIVISTLFFVIWDMFGIGLGMKVSDSFNSLRRFLALVRLPT